MNRKVVVTSVVAAGGVLMFSLVAIKPHFFAGPQKAALESSAGDLTSRQPPDLSATVEHQPAQPGESADSGMPAVTSPAPSTPPDQTTQEMISGLSEDMQALYAKSQADDWEAQQKAAQIVVQTEERKIPLEESRLLAVAASQVLGAEYNSDAIADVTWQPVNEEFALPDDEQFYGASVDQACAGDMCKLQFQGLSDETSRDIAIDKLLTANRIPKGSMIVPAEQDAGQFTVIYPKKEN